MSAMTATTEPTTQEIEDLRKAFLDDLATRGESAIHDNDLNKVKTDNQYLARFLKHHEGNQKSALEMMKVAFEWRKSFNVNEINAKTVKVEYMVEGGFFARGRDKDGCALLILKCIKHVKNDSKRDLNEVKRCLLYWIEKLEREENGKPISIFFDLENCGLGQMDLEFTKYIIGLFKEYYPYFLNYIIIYEMAWILNAAFHIIQKLLPEKAVQKIKRVKKNDVLNYVPQEQALKCWGGQDDYVFSFLPDAPEEVMTFSPSNKKVHFEENGSVVKDSQNMSDREKDSGVLSVSPASIITFVKDGKEFISTVELKNISTGTFLSYKMKTTAPEKFRVRPSVGILLPGNTATIVITLLPGYHIGGLSKDKFLILSLPLQSDTMSPQELAELWTSTSGKSVSQHHLRCAQTSPVPTRNGNALYADSGAEGSDILKLSTSVSRLQESQENLEKALQRTQNLQFLNMVLLVLLGMGLFHFIFTFSGDSIDSCQVPNAEL